MHTQDAAYFANVLSHQANEPKDRLMSLQSKLESLGMRRKAKALGTILAKLERWQNTPI